MQTNRFYSLMMLFLMAVLGYFSYRIMSPFFAAVAWAIVVTIIFYPLYAFISRHVRAKPLASIITLLVVLVVILGPITYLTSMLVNEIQLIASKINDNQLDTVQAFLVKIKSNHFLSTISSYTGIEDLTTTEALRDSVRRLGKGLMEDFSMRIPNMLSVVLDFIFMIFTTFFFLKDGPRFLSRATEYMPFSLSQKERLTTQIKDMIVSTVYGGVLIAIIQGALGGFAFYFLGIDSPVMWGVAMAVMSFVPLLGTFAIWGPASFLLVFEEAYLRGIGLFLFGVFVISMVDNILKPIIIGSRTKIPTILILFSVLGGIKLFGVIGLIMGPLVIAVFISVFEIFSKIEAGTTSD